MIIPVILSGGAGTRLWPLSTTQRPKQFHALTGERTMLQATAERVTDAARFAAPIIVASAAHADDVERQLDGVGVRPHATILEPVGRNTAAAIALAALEVGAEELLLVMPSDHAIGRPERFIEAVERAAVPARQGWLVTFGIAPDRPETGYGYIRRAEAIAAGAFAVLRFVEKPDAVTAAAYIRDGGYDWNGGIFLFRAGDMLDALARHAPDILDAARAVHAGALRQGSRIALDPDRFSAIRSQSIDHAVMEKHERVAVVPVAMEWSDVGSWDALYDIGGKDESDNSISGHARLLDSEGCLVHAHGLNIVGVGLRDLIVVASGGNVLILPRGESQRVKDVATSDG